MSREALVLDGIAKSYRQPTGNLDILRDVQLTLRGGEAVALIGPSGAGKSTLMHIAGLLDNADQGTITVDGVALSKNDDRTRTKLRRTKIGFVYQFHHLLPEFSALENVVLPQMINGHSRSRAKRKALELLERVGLEHRALHRPARLSGGEQQRVAIVRALANDPVILLADEPTGNLDPSTANNVFASLRELVADAGLAALIATHNIDLARRMDRIVRLEDGRLVSGE